HHADVDDGEEHPATGLPKAHDGYRHEAFLWKGEHEFLAGTVPFVQEAVAEGQPVLVALIRPRIEWIRRELEGSPEGVAFVDMAELGRNPARIIPAWRSFIDANGGGSRPLRGIGEPVWAGRRSPEVTECQVHESLLNLAIGPTVPLWLRCPYEADALDGAVIDEAHRSHPQLVERGEEHGSTSYGGMAHIRAAFELPLPEPAAAHVDVEAFGVADLGRLRALVRERAHEVPLGQDRVEDLVLAVHEVSANSVDHGGGGGVLRVWREADRIVCEVRDRGRIHDPLVGRRTPTGEQGRGRGLWLANQLCDLVQIRSLADGTVVRVSCWL
ncbi:MAG: anti-sigma factor RsbA family regulatory protein, partial [Oryzihumus sp.]